MKHAFGVVLLLVAAPALTAQAPIDLIPSDALGGLVIRNTSELVKKGDQLIADTGIDIPIRFSDILPAAFLALGLPANQIDDKLPFSFVVANPKIIDPKATKPDRAEQCLVVGLPCKTFEAMEKALGLELGSLKGGKAVKTTKQMGNLGNLQWAAARDKHILLGVDARVVESVAKTKGLSADLSAEQRKFLNESDVVLHLGTDVWGDMWKELLRDIGNNLEHGDEENKKVGREFVEMLRGVKFGLASLRVDSGIGLSFLSVFPKEGSEAAKKFLTSFRGGPGASNLRGLPEGNVVAALGAKGDGAENAPIARVFFRLLVQEVLMPSRFVGGSEKPALLSIFNEVWQRLRGSRLALYRTSDTTELGLFSVVGIMDTEEPEKFLDELKRLAKLGAADGLDFTNEENKKANEAEIEKLIKDLGHRRFAVRDSAAAKLALAGDQILPYLEKAIQSSDLEVKRTAERLKQDIVQLAEDRRKELLSGDLARQLRPSFAFTGKTEKVEGLEAQLVTVKLPKKDAAYVPHLKALLGPDWHKVRFAVHGKQVIALVGSDLGLLQRAIRNVKEEKPGLAATKVMEAQAKHTDAKRKMELHASALMVAALAKAADLETPAKLPANPPLSSVVLSLETDRFQIDFWMPAAEIKAVVAASK